MECQAGVETFFKSNEKPINFTYCLGSEFLSIKIQNYTE